MSFWRVERSRLIGRMACEVPGRRRDSPSKATAPHLRGKSVIEHTAFAAFLGAWDTSLQRVTFDPTRRTLGLDGQGARSAFICSTSPSPRSHGIKRGWWVRAGLMPPCVEHALRGALAAYYGVPQDASRLMTSTLRSPCRWTGPRAVYLRPLPIERVGTVIALRRMLAG